ncbi:Uma2 family endonuclease [Pseudonocardia kunmingensis]|uniref:Uma2 family endonuclease n=1 Tax=Pseudonocardia kunmingensis TaxID=630975 RepID=A0A543DLC4_9PSEU|nr:Uma2 family endonuclease [Pseudonocardia kunmingensis]TQM10119.1 Uma2 family endonuclease [Pseudonocardia kunmingensis]
MAIQPVAPSHLLTVAEYLEIGEIELGYSELVEGRLLMSPSPVPAHNRAGFELAVALRGALPRGMQVIPDIDVDLQLAPPDAPGTVRRPDLVIVSSEALLRVEREGGVLRASEVVLVVEVVSPGSTRTDHVHKRDEYADAGIPHYWILDISEPVSLLACHLAGEFGYADAGAVTGGFTVEEPFPVEIDLDALR